MNTREACEAIASMGVLNTLPFDGTPIYLRMREIARAALTAEAAPTLVQAIEDQRRELIDQLAQIRAAAVQVRLDADDCRLFASERVRLRVLALTAVIERRAVKDHLTTEVEKAE